MSKRQQELIDHIEDSILKAEANESKLPRSVSHDIHGMSSYKTRAFMNNLVNIPGGKYLEIGSWKGSTLISACYDNDLKEAISIENWSQPHGDENKDFKGSFFDNMLEHAEHMPTMQIIDRDCWDVDPNSIGPVDVYFYDGDHSEDSQTRAFTHFKPCIGEETIVIVDDWEFRDGQMVQPGTRRGIKEAGFNVIHERIIHTGNDWWFGFALFLLKSL